LIIRAATKDDAAELAVLINMAAEHLPAYQWQQMSAGDQAPMAFGATRAARDEGAFSYANARVAEIGGEVAGMLLGYRQPDPYDTGDLDAVSPILRPLIELESIAPGSWYVNAIATYEQFRGRGVGRALMQAAEQAARSSGASELSLIVASLNTGAAAMYRRLGYAERARLSLVLYPKGPPGGEWVLMVKRLPG
jgi:ribosomal protein S18 acetylase RimI-like enzyme